MWREKLDNGKYRYCERYEDPMTGKTRKVSVTMEKGSKQAEKAAREKLRQKIMEKCAAPPAAEMTFGELCALYLSATKPEIKLSTWTRNSYAMETLKGILGESVQCSGLSAGYIRRKLLETGKQPVTLNENLTRLKAMLRWAYRNDYIDDIRYLDKLDRFRDAPHRQKIEDKYLESAELAAVLDSMDQRQWRMLAEFLALSGLRFGEAAALLRSDIDLQDRVIHVTKTFDPNNKIVTSPKSYGSVRDVYMQDELYRLCREILLDDRVLSVSNLFFHSGAGHVCYAAFRKYFGDHTEKAIGRRLTPHALRHTHASLLMEQGIGIETISARLGHSDSRVTKEIYLHVTEKLKEKRNREVRDVTILPPGAAAE